MNEAGFWSGFVKEALHKPEEGRIAWKLQDATNRGLPDVLAVEAGDTALIELKYVKEYPKRDDTNIQINTSVEQVRRLAQWAQAGGLAYVLIGVDKDWYLLPHHVARSMTRRQLFNFHHGVRSKNYHLTLRDAIFHSSSFVERIERGDQ